MKWPVNNRPIGVQLRVDEGWQFELDEGTGRDRIARVSPGSSISGYAPFKTDQEAYDHVAKKAAEGSEYHITCLAYVAKERLRT